MVMSMTVPVIVAFRMRMEQTHRVTLKNSFADIGRASLRNACMTLVRLMYHPRTTGPDVNCHEECR
jgi:hypothetical protein